MVAATKLEDKSNPAMDKIEKTFTDELIFGICSPIGSLRQETIDSLKKILTEEYSYIVRDIKLSSYITKFYKKRPKPEQGKSENFSVLMNKIKGGDYVRKKYNKSILVEAAIAKIRAERVERKAEDVENKRICYIIDSLKNIEELKLLRSVYRELFYLFGVFSTEQERKSNLAKKIVNEQEAEQLINADYSDPVNLHGQNVKEVFIEADFFMRISKYNKNDIDVHTTKFLHLIFNSKIITPNYHETAMYHAKSASVNSACLSRQVGAAITDPAGITITRGWNDVPKFEGNLYRDPDKNDDRCKKSGECRNVARQKMIIDKIIKEIKTNTNIQSVKKIKTILEKSGIKDIIEYSRAIHAEMHAIVTGAQLTGNKMVGGSLYCTTYPCHNCMRHIILAGIKNVYYIEPYKKSLGLELHGDALSENEEEDTKVKVLLYEGVSPRRYLEFFSMNSKRKDEKGKIIKVDLHKVKPKIRLSLQAIPNLENQAIHSLSAFGLIDKL